MRGSKISLTSDQKAEVKRLREDGLTWDETAAYFGLSEDGLRRNIDSAYRERRNAQIRKHARANRAATKSDFTRRGEHLHSDRPAVEQIADAIRRANAPRTLTSSFFGDPPPGYSALDRMGRS